VLRKAFVAKQRPRIISSSSSPSSSFIRKEADAEAFGEEEEDEQ
jgi:hypothetical protein